MAKNGVNAITEQQYEATMRRHGTADWTREDERVQAEWLAQQNTPDEPAESAVEPAETPAEGDVYPVDGTAADVVAWVGRATGEDGDTEHDRATAALAAEQERGDKARVGLTRDLEKKAQAQQ
jgi:hypothetical protein